MKHLKTFKQFESADYYTANSASSMGPGVNYDCPDCLGNNTIYDSPGTNPIQCEFCGEQFEYPWGPSWRWS